MFPTAQSSVYYNEEGEPLGWDNSDAHDEPYESDEMDDSYEADEYDDEYENIKTDEDE